MSFEQNEINCYYEKDKLGVILNGSWIFVSEIKDKLKSYGFSWDSDQKVWFKNIPFSFEEKKQIIKEDCAWFMKNFPSYFKIEEWKKIANDIKEEQIRPSEEIGLEQGNLSDHMWSKLMPHQKIAIQKYKNQENHILNSMTMGLGKCIYKDTEIYINDKLITVEKFWNERNEETEVDKYGYEWKTIFNCKTLSFDIENNNTKISNVNKLFRMKYKGKMIKLSLKNGREIICAPNHKFFNGIDWIKTENIKIKDFITIFDTTNIESISSINDVLITNDLLKFVSYYITNLNCNNIPTLKAMKILKDKIDLCICSKSEGVYIPYWVFKLNKEKIAFFLKNLFDGDGGCYYQYDENRNRHKMSVEYDSKSIILIKQIQFLLMKFGILGNISSRIIKNLKYYRIHITGEYVEKFYSIINFDNNYKKEKLEKMQGNNLYYKTKLIPFINRDILRNICTSTGDFYMYFKEQNFTNNTINKFLDWIKTENIKKKYNIDNEIKKLETIKDRNLIYIRVEKIEEIYVDEYIYDLEVDIYHNYWAESFLTHNTLSSLATVKYYNKKAFLIVPKSLVIQWKNEILKWKVTTEDKIFVFTDNKSRNLEFRLRDYDFYIMNYEKVNFLSYEEFDKKTKEKYWTDYESELFKEIKKLTLSDFILVYDEMYKIKNYKSGVYKAHKKFRNLNWSGIIGLTGTPMENSLYEFYTILNFIKPNTISFMDMEKYFVFRTGYGPVIFRNLGKFNRMASKIMYRVNRDEVKLSLPKVTQEYRFLEASKDAQDMKSKLLRNAPSLFEIYSLLRVLDSYLDPTNEESKYFPLIKKVEQKNKLEELLEIIEEIGEKQIVIFTSYEKTCVWLYDQLKDKFKCKWVSSKTKDVNEIKEEFITGDIQVLICTDTLAYGTNFNQIDYLVNWDIHPNPARMQQRANRIVRIDSVNPKLIISLVSNIIEKDIYELIRDKIEKFELTVEGTDEKHLMSEIAKRWGIK